MNIVASIEARIGSTRFPNKMIEDIEGKNTLERVIERLKKVDFLSNIILATTQNAEDDILCQIAKNNDIHFFRGSENNVFKRVREAHKKLNSDIILTICGDCPLIDFDLINKYLFFFQNSNYDALTFDQHHTCPQGVEFFVFSKKTFFKPKLKTLDKFQKEHVGLHFLENEDKYNIFKIRNEEFKKDYSNIRLQFDYQEDLILIKEIYKYFEKKNINFNSKDIVSFLKKNPRLKDINSHCIEKEVRY